MKQIFNNPKTLRLIIIVLSVFFLAVCADLYRGLTQEEVIDYNTYEYELENVVEYQGPVPQGYDVEYFRETGKTIKEVEK